MIPEVFSNPVNSMILWYSMTLWCCLSNCNGRQQPSFVDFILNFTYSLLSNTRRFYHVIVILVERTQISYCDISNWAIILRNVHVLFLMLSQMKLQILLKCLRNNNNNNSKSWQPLKIISHLPAVLGITSCLAGKSWPNKPLWPDGRIKI